MLIKDYVINKNIFLESKGYSLSTEKHNNFSFLLQYKNKNTKFEIDYFIEERDNEVNVAIYLIDTNVLCLTDNIMFWEGFDRRNGRFGISYNSILLSNTNLGSVEWFNVEFNALKKRDLKRKQQTTRLIDIYAKLVLQYIASLSG